jgi:phosphate starvation-inducible PhoH-like protein
VILDEAQNTTSIQMKMFLTRLGFHSKAIITGDITQVDLQTGRSGLIAVQDVLTGIEGITFVRLSKSDVVRHPLVARIIEAYDRQALRVEAEEAPAEQVDVHEASTP